MSHNTYHLSPVTCHLSPVTCHQRQQPQLQTIPLLNPPQCTVGWLPKTEQNKAKKFRIWDTLNLLTNPYSRTDTKKNSAVTVQVLHFTCHLSTVICHLLPITCHMSLTPTATATDPPPFDCMQIQANFLI